MIVCNATLTRSQYLISCERLHANHSLGLKAADKKTTLRHKETKAARAIKRRLISLVEYTIKICANKFEVCIELAGFWNSEFANRIRFANCD